MGTFQPRHTSNSTSDVGTVSHSIRVAATDGVVPERGTTVKLGVSGEKTSVYDVGIGTAAS